MSDLSSDMNVYELCYSDAAYEQVHALLCKFTGIDIGSNKHAMVYRRLAPRLRALEITSFQEYFKRLDDCLSFPSERQEFIDLLTVTKTSFFREPHHFEHLKALLSELAEQQATGTLRIWSAGCSSGMEAYSIAMLCNQMLPDTKKWDVKVLATDINTNMLAHANQGCFTYEEVQDVPKSLRDTCFQAETLEEDGYTQRFRVKKAVKDLVSFKLLNLCDEDWPMRQPFDVVFCRNVLIYFDKNRQNAVLQHFSELLRPGGMLYLGHSELMCHERDDFTALGQTRYQRLERVLIDDIYS